MAGQSTSDSSGANGPPASPLEHPIVFGAAPEPTIGSDTVDELGAAEGHEDIPEASQPLVSVEGAASSSLKAPNAPRGESLVAYLFHGDQPPQEIPHAAISEHSADTDSFVWCDLSGYDERELRDVGRMFGLHRNAVHSALSAWQRPHLDLFADQCQVTTTVARLEPQTQRVLVGQLDIFVGRNFLVSAHRLPLPFFERVRQRAHQSPELVHGEPAFLLYIILDELLAYYDGLEERMRVQVEHFEDSALTDTSEDFLHELLRFKRYAFTLSQLVDQHRQVFAALLRPDLRILSSDDAQVYFRDLQNRLERLVDNISGAREATIGAFDIYTSHVAHRTNAVIKTLTLVSTVLLPVAVIVGVFSTHIAGLAIYQVSDFLFALVVFAVTLAAMLLIFRRKGWI